MGGKDMGRREDALELRTSNPSASKLPGACVQGCTCCPIATIYLIGILREIVIQMCLPSSKHRDL